MCEGLTCEKRLFISRTQLIMGVMYCQGEEMFWLVDGSVGGHSSQFLVLAIHPRDFGGEASKKSFQSQSCISVSLSSLLWWCGVGIVHSVGCESKGWYYSTAWFKPSICKSCKSCVVLGGTIVLHLVCWICG